MTLVLGRFHHNHTGELFAVSVGARRALHPTLKSRPAIDFQAIIIDF